MVELIFVKVIGLLLCGRWFYGQLGAKHIPIGPALAQIAYSHNTKDIFFMLMLVVLLLALPINF